MNVRTRRIAFLMVAALLLFPTAAQAGSWWQTNATDTVGSGFWELQDDNAGFASPHGGFSSTSNLCKTCHAVHMAGENSWRMVKSGNTTETRTQGEMSTLGKGNSRATECMYCHDATSGATSKKPYELTPLGASVRGEHSLGATRIPDSSINAGGGDWGILADRSPSEGAVLQCYQCHSVHGSDTIGTTNSVEGNVYDASDAVESWNSKILRLDPGGDGSVLAKGEGGLSAATWQTQLDTDGAAVRTGFCADCHNLNPNWEIDSSDTTRPNNRSHPQGPGTDSKMEVYGTTMTVAAHPLERMGCRGCHYASVGDDGAGVSRFPHQSVGWKLLFDEATMTGGTSDLAGNPQRIIPGMDTICLSCHAVFTDIATESGKCLNCHDSKYGAPDIGDEIRKAYGMGIQDLSSPHTAGGEVAADFADGNRHANCDDCHNAQEIFPWEDTPLTGMGGIGVTNGAAGTDPVYTPKSQVSSQEELCFKCHSSYTTQPDSSTYKGMDFATDPINDDGSPLKQGNRALELNPANSAYHPVEARGRNESLNLCFQLQDAFGLDCDTTVTAAASLAGLMLKCTDCHNNDQIGSEKLGRSSNATGTEADGPHGSENQWVLRGTYDRDLTYPRLPYGSPEIVAGWLTDATVKTNFGLCFTCHDYDRLMGEWWWDDLPSPDEAQGGGTAATNFSIYPFPAIVLKTGNLHRFHIKDQNAQAKCPDCHYNVHGNEEAQNIQYGVYKGSGDVAQYASFNWYTDPPASTHTHLLNFAPHAEDNSFGTPSWRIVPSTGVRYCNLNCHNAPLAFDQIMNWGYAPFSGDDDHTSPGP